VDCRINLIDLSSAEALVAENERLKKHGGALYFVELKYLVYEFATRSCFIKKIGANHFFDSKTEARRSIYNFLESEACPTCKALIFSDCA